MWALSTGTAVLGLWGDYKLGTLAAEQKAGSPELGEHNVWFVTGRGGVYLGAAGPSLASRVRAVGY